MYFIFSGLANKYLYKPRNMRRNYVFCKKNTRHILFIYQVLNFLRLVIFRAMVIFFYKEMENEEKKLEDGYG